MHPTASIFHSVDQPRQRSVLSSVKRKLRRSPYHAVRLIICEYHEGMLTLHGSLTSYYLKQVAQQAVTGIPGVEEVVNRIRVV